MREMAPAALELTIPRLLSHEHISGKAIHQASNHTTRAGDIIVKICQLADGAPYLRLPAVHNHPAVWQTNHLQGETAEGDESGQHSLLVLIASPNAIALHYFYRKSCPGLQ